MLNVHAALIGIEIRQGLGVIVLVNGEPAGKLTFVMITGQTPVLEIITGSGPENCRLCIEPNAREDGDTMIVGTQLPPLVGDGPARLSTSIRLKGLLI